MKSMSKGIGAFICIRFCGRSMATKLMANMTFTGLGSICEPKKGAKETIGKSLANNKKKQAKMVIGSCLRLNIKDR
jgi:hypothetical protein